MGMPEFFFDSASTQKGAAPTDTVTLHTGERHLVFVARIARISYLQFGHCFRSLFDMGQLPPSLRQTSSTPRFTARLQLEGRS